MEFGKKGDAKKAMKLKWKKGITLKQAWKEIKGGKKYSSKRKTKTSPKRKRVQNNAKKAMRMHHREGISLKQAWKRVLNTKSRFGARGLTWDSDCPSGYESNPSIFGNPCLKKCGPHQERNPKTNKCVGSYPRRVAKHNKTPHLTPTKVETIIPSGYELNPTTGRLRKICTPDQYRDPVTGRCRAYKGNLSIFGSRNCSRCSFGGTCSACDI